MDLLLLTYLILGSGEGILFDWNGPGLSFMSYSSLHFFRLSLIDAFKSYSKLLGFLKI